MVPTPDPRRVGIVIATRNRARELVGTLERLASFAADHPVIVVDNASEDRTPEIVRNNHPRVQVIDLEENAGSGARNVGVELLETPYVAFCDDDSWWAPGSLGTAAGAFDNHPELALIAGTILVGEGKRIDPVCSKMAAGPTGKGHPGRAIVGFVACGAVVRRSAFLGVGGFDSRFGIGGEEDLLALDLSAAGWHLAYVDEIVAHHVPSPSRNPARRRAVMARNALWTAWLRRRAASAFAETTKVLGLCVRDRAARAGTVEALRGLPWVLRERQAVPRHVEERLEAIAGREPSDAAALR